MQYLCERQFTAGRVDYHPGDIVPDGVILSNRSGKLIKSGYISELKVPEISGSGQETVPGTCDGMVHIYVESVSDGGKKQRTAIPVRPREIQQTFSVMQMSAEEGVKAISDVDNENVLILLHAADSRKTIKNAAKERADKLFPAEGGSSESADGNKSTDTDMEGTDT